MDFESTKTRIEQRLTQLVLWEQAMQGRGEHVVGGESVNAQVRTQRSSLESALGQAEQFVNERRQVAQKAAIEFEQLQQQLPVRIAEAQRAIVEHQVVASQTGCRVEFDASAAQLSAVEYNANVQRQSWEKARAELDILSQQAVEQENAGQSAPATAEQINQFLADVQHEAGILQKAMENTAEQRQKLEQHLQRLNERDSH